MIRKIGLYGKAGSGKDYLAKYLIDYLKETTTHDARRFAFADSLKELSKNIIMSDIDDVKYNSFLHDENAKNNTYVDLETYNLIAFGKNISIEHKDSYNPSIINGSLFGYSDDVNICVWTAASLGKFVGDNFSDNISVSNVFKDKREKCNVIMNIMSYREFIVYYGTYIIQRTLGRDYFINRVFNSKEYTECILNDDFIVVTDIRFESEYKKCKDEGFFIIRVENTSRDFGINNIAESNYDKFSPDYVFYNSYDKVLFDTNFDKLISNILHKNNFQNYEFE